MQILVIPTVSMQSSREAKECSTPADFGNEEPEEIVTERAISGTLGILKSCLKSKTVKRVVYTSGASGVVFNGQDLDMLDESFWSDVDFIRGKLTPILSSYMISKTWTEWAALEFGAQHGLEVVTVIPSFVNVLSYAPNSQCGEQHAYRALLNTPMVHVDDVSGAHIFLLEYPDAKGRYNFSSYRMSLQKMSEFLSAKYPVFQH
ncbi:putative NAD(P)-binding Rossmann-fold superfamily protein [Hibiscus syriacus]|uniref:NAD(P)-binding Rossmann-fold superfamily protein n=1 Tax=Hibiscus syriacus TaxID=106335 RepID=A0A6A2XZQ2_HIBSY|nr:putative NAD(P)-binding Rossmann-fold superfamily protein [Hibiscus syriacus]